MKSIMKQRSTTPIASSLTARAAIVAMAVLMAGSGVIQFGAQVMARDYDSEIKAKEQEAAKYRSEATRLGQVADTLQGEVNRLQAQINSIQAQIAASQKKINDLNARIAANKRQIEKNREVLGDILSDIYVDDQISPLEMLASSKNISEFIDKQEQRSSLRSSLNDKIKEIRSLQQRLEKDKKSVEQVLVDQQAQRRAVAAKQAEQAKLLNDTKNDQNAYAGLASQRNSEISKLREQQAQENLRQIQNAGMGNIPPASGGNGGYPAVWANAPMDSIVDNWGMYNRECVSYVAYKIAASGRYMPFWGGRGHAYQWPDNAASAGIPTGSTPKTGAAAIMYGGPYGHVMYVESVNSDGTITVSDYNLGVDGLYRHYTRSAAGLTYIYF